MTTSILGTKRNRFDCSLKAVQFCDVKCILEGGPDTKGGVIAYLFIKVIMKKWVFFFNDIFHSGGKLTALRV